MISEENVRKTFSKLAVIDAPSLGEREIADRIKAMFDSIGVELKEDDSGQVTGSSAGNLYGYIKGDDREPILLSAHMDTVMPALGKKAVFHPDGRITSDGSLSHDTALKVAENYKEIFEEAAVRNGALAEATIMCLQRMESVAL